MTSPKMKVFVCTTCRPKQCVEGNKDDRPGQHMFERLQGKIAQSDLEDEIQVTPVECLSVCKRPATIALTTPTHWTYIYGDLDPDKDLDNIIAGLRAYLNTDDGIVPWAERVSIFKSGVVARIPPSKPNQKPENTFSENSTGKSKSNEVTSNEVTCNEVTNKQSESV